MIPTLRKLLPSLALPVPRAHHRRLANKLLLSPPLFARLLQKERLRAARHGTPYCVIRLCLPPFRDRHSDARTITGVARMLRRRLRMTDECGWVDNQTVGVLLVETAEAGGEAVMRDLAAMLRRRKIDAQLTLRVHDPSQQRRDPPDADGGIPESAPGWAGGRCQAPASAAHATSVVASLRSALLRGIDVAVAAVGLLVAAPPIAAAALLVRATSPGPAFYCQRREGRDGETFVIYKLRTMCDGADREQAALRSASHRDGPAFKLQDDPRVTPVGRILRATCLDELPQLWNVLRGEMSLVGPRPLPVDESRACEGWQRRRLDVRPGITGIWQINKHRPLSFDDWMRLDLRYVDRGGLGTYFAVIARTPLIVLRFRGGD